ncbi:glycosyltransferase family 2 protein [Aliiglaciecola sp. 3_MG-2023]|uniref:glycosyltransferase n=1 Tax=Aliiglaciecola sp. 3_MG-2023 TaxID=3062644 RepID=UPI0026E2D2A4|nr:glycosyltransferase family 2 protein [Aliiglaciecola sp. 3_MG-2023]MDO6691933.1 glycosyltransferase family 2 protein [Aliiglaciecola sp. 3_MG-2023]
MKKLATVVIRTFNEARYLDELLSEISKQNTKIVENEVVIVDSGSTDNTLEIAQKHNCRITHIKQSEFTFGRSLNIGCEFAKGDILVFVSGHCIPASVDWLDELCRPIVEQIAVYTYGRQMGRDTTKYSETKHFDKWFPEYSKIPQEGFFCNNANAAVSRVAWKKFGFNEELTGLEDMYLAKQLVEIGSKIGYVSSAPVYHIHDESWSKLRTRYEREAYALQKIMPEVHFSFSDFLRFLVSGVMTDFAAAIREKVFLKRCIEIVLFRYNHYWGTYKGNHEMRKLSAKQKFHYFYPKDVEKEFYHD